MTYITIHISITDKPLRVTNDFCRGPVLSLRHHGIDPLSEDQPVEQRVDDLLGVDDDREGAVYRASVSLQPSEPG